MRNWQEHIVTDPKILLGKPIIKDTRISVEFILERLATERQIAQQSNFSPFLLVL